MYTCDRETIAGNLRAARARTRMSQAEAAKKANIPSASLKRYELGETKIPLEVAVNLANAYNISLERLAE